MKSYTNVILVTGEAGFIGSTFVLHWISQNKGKVINLELLTYARNLANLAWIEGKPDHLFVLRKTALANEAWMDEVTSGAYQNWVHVNYGQRGEQKNTAPAGTR